MSEPTSDEIKQMEESAAAEAAMSPEAKKARQKDRDNRKKLAILADQLYRHAKLTGLQVFIFGEGLEAGSITESSYCSSEMISAMIMHVRIKHPQLFSEANRKIEDFVNSQEKAEEPPRLIVEP